ncbi:MAG: helix-turn-helix domain-containing protein, partial [Xanthomonadales bacterium]|nr:helix-turn-helix domain-containing protein [Xanthomonadales bacterium]
MNVQTIDQPDAAACLLQPPRSEILRALRQPGSAASVARELGLPRQRVTYHVRQLEKHGLLDHVEDRRVGNCMERVVRARAARFMISPRVLGELGLDRDALADRFSSAYLVASASAAAETVAAQREAARAADRKLATLTLESKVAFADPAVQAAFA